MISREFALQNVVACLDNALARCHPSKMPENARLCVWEGDSGGASPVVVAVWSYLGTTDGQRDRLGDGEATEIAADFLSEVGIVDEGTLPDYVL